MADLNPFRVAQHQVDVCCEALGLEDSVRRLLRSPMRELHVTFPVKMDDGTTRVFHGYRVQYNGARGPTKGGLRFHPDETADTVRALAAWMTWKTALLDLPLGGAKGGVVCNPKELSQTELERLTRAWVGQIWLVIGPDRDVPAPDVYTDAQTMAWVMDEYSKRTGRSQFGVVTGKPLLVGGSAGRHDATARGGMYCIREAARLSGLDLTQATVAIQGFGNAGQNAALLARALLGCEVVAVSDSKGGVYCEGGLNPRALIQHKLRTGSVVDAPSCRNISNEELLALDVDILIPAALESAITDANADQVRAKVVAELANGPTTPEADAVLFDKHIDVIPDFLCNAGGVTVSYFEMVQNASFSAWKADEVHRQLDEKMTTAYRAVAALAKTKGIRMRDAAYRIAVTRVVDAMKLRGWI